MLNMYISPMIPEGWNIKSDFKELQYQLHGDILPKGYEIVFSESSDFAEFVDIPDEIQKSAKPGFIFNNPLTGNSLQKGQDGLWRGIKQKAKKFVNKVKSKFGKPQQTPQPPQEEEEDDFLPRDPEAVKRPGEKEEIQKDMKPELSPKEEEKVQGIKDSALTEVEHGFFMTMSGISKNPEKHLMMAKTAAKDAAKLIAKQTGQSPSKVLDELMKKGQGMGAEKAFENIATDLAPLYQQMEDIKYLTNQGVMSKQEASSQSLDLIDSILPLQDKLKSLAQQKIDAGLEEGTVEEVKDKLLQEVIQQGKQLHEKNKDNLLPSQDDDPWKQEKELPTPEIFKELISDLQSSVTNNSLKNPMKNLILTLNDTFEHLTRTDDMQSTAKFLGGLSDTYKSDTQIKFKNLRNKIRNMKALGDPGYEQAKNSFNELMNKLKDMGLEELIPGNKIGEEKAPKEPEISEEEKNYGYMLDADFKYEPQIKFEDLSEVYQKRFRDLTEYCSDIFQNLPDNYGTIDYESVAAIRTYTGSAYTNINNVARGKATIADGKEYKKSDFLIQQIDRGLQNMRLQPPEELKRGVGSKKLRAALSARKPGDIIHDHGYFSASAESSTASSFKGYGADSEVMFTIKNAQGYYIERITECGGEEERIFPRGSAFKITSIKEVGKELQVEMEHILSDSEREKYEKQKAEEEEQKNRTFTAEIPKSIDILDYAKGKPLGGSTGARLLEINGTKFVVKKGANEEQNKQEQLANSLYNAVGAKTSNSGISNMDGKPVVVSEYIPGKDLGDQPLNTSEDIKKFGEQIIKGHAMDALINNRDVFGLNYDNIRIGDNGEVYRIDNGGSFDTKATGGKKPFDGVPLEFISMLERGGGKEFYHDVPIEAAYESIDALFSNYEQIKEIAKTQVPENLKGTFFKRLSNLREVKDCWDYCMSIELKPRESHRLVKEYLTALHKKEPDGTISYPQFKKFVIKKVG